MVDAETQLAGYIAAYNKSAKRRGLPIYADPVPVGKLSDLLDADRPNFMTPDQCAAFREGFFRRMTDVLTPLAEQGFSYRKGQSKKAKKSRGLVSEHGKTLNQIIGELALDRAHQEWLAKELWPLLYAELDLLKLDPDDQECADDWKKSRYEYNFKEGRKAITGGQFANEVSAYRKGKKSG